MKIISNEVRSLLDKLYNLRGADSVILKQMNKERQEAIETQERTRNEKEVLLKEIDRLTNEEALLAEQGNKLMEVLGNINRDDFAFVLDELKLNFEPNSLNEKVSRLLPETIDKVVMENKSAQEKLNNVENEMNNAITKVEELGIRKDEALSNQNKLNEYFNLALSGNINITRDEIVSLLQKFDFSLDEQREAAKLLMFPEDALYDYDENVKNNHYKPEVKVETPIAKEEIITEDIIKEEPKVEALEEIKPEIEVAPVEPKKIEINETIAEEETVNPDTAKGKLEKVMIDAGLDCNEFSTKAITKILENYDEELLKNNVEILRNYNMNLDILLENFELLYDKELKAKVEKLLEIGKDVQDICLMPSVLVKYDLNGLNNTINVLQISGLDPKKVPLMAY